MRYEYPSFTSQLSLHRVQPHENRQDLSRATEVESRHVPVASLLR